MKLTARTTFIGRPKRHDANSVALAATKAKGGCIPCSKGKTKNAAAVNMDQWHNAVNQTEGNE